MIALLIMATESRVAARNRSDKVTIKYRLKRYYYKFNGVKGLTLISHLISGAILKSKHSRELSGGGGSKGMKKSDGKNFTCSSCSNHSVVLSTSSTGSCWIRRRPPNSLARGSPPPPTSAPSCNSRACASCARSRLNGAQSQ